MRLGSVLIGVVALLVLAVMPAAAQTDADACEQYPIGDCLEIVADVSGPACEAVLPAIGYSVRVAEGDAPAEIEVTFVAPDGQRVSRTGQPLEGTLLWPGATMDGSSVDWPGWRVGDDGWYLEDASALTFPISGVQIIFSVDGDVSFTVDAPTFQTAACAPDDEQPPDEGSPEPDVEVGGVVVTREPPESPSTGSGTSVLGVTLARTGVDTTWLVAIGVGLALIGVVILRRSQHRDDGA